MLKPAAVRKREHAKPVSFRPDPDVARLVARLDACRSINRSDAFNRALAIGLPRVMEEIVEETRRLTAVRN
jgi:hypothetical protein